MGCSTAYYLALRGIPSRIIECHEVACGASGKAGGFLALDWSSETALDSLARKSFDLHLQISKHFGADAIGYRPVTTLSVSATESPVKKTKQKLKEEKPPLPWLDGKWDEETQSGVKIDNQVKTIGTLQTTAQVTPYLLSQALLNYALEKGSTLIKGKVIGYEFESNDENNHTEKKKIKKINEKIQIRKKRKKKSDKLKE